MSGHDTGGDETETGGDETLRERLVRLGDRLLRIRTRGRFSFDCEASDGPDCQIVNRESVVVILKRGANDSLEVQAPAGANPDLP